jgi:DNA-binding transcriptional MerR regulator
MRISEVSEGCGLSGLLPPVNRKNGGIRDYSELDVRRVEFIKCMRSVGLPIEVLIEYFKLAQQGDHTIEARKQILVEQRAQLAAKMEEMQQTLDFLDYKIEVYEQAILKAEKKMVRVED